MTSGISYHVAFDAIHDNTQPLLDHLDKLKPRVINIIGAARKPEAFAFAKLLKARYENMRVIWRNYPDDGLHATDRYKLVYHRDNLDRLIIDDAYGCQRWVDDNVDYLKAGLTVLTDNESTRDDLDVYAEWQAHVMDICGKEQWAVAVGRFATGNPQMHQYVQLDAMWKALARWAGLHTWSPNEYARSTWEGNGGNVQRFENAFKRCEQIPVIYPVTSIGEWGVCYSAVFGQLDPHKGYRHEWVQMGGAAYARFVIENWKAWYKPQNVDLCIFCWGDSLGGQWDSFRVDQDREFLTTLELAAKMGDLLPVTTKPPAPVDQPNYTPPKLQSMGLYHVKLPDTTRAVHHEPDKSSDRAGTVVQGQVVKFIDSKAVGVDWWFKISWDRPFNGGVDVLTGWICLDGNRVRFLAATQEIPAAPPDTPVDTENPAKPPSGAITGLSREFVEYMIRAKELELGWWREVLAKVA